MGSFLAFTRKVSPNESCSPSELYKLNINVQAGTIYREISIDRSHDADGSANLEKNNLRFRKSVDGNERVKQYRLSITDKTREITGTFSNARSKTSCITDLVKNGVSVKLFNTLQVMPIIKPVQLINNNIIHTCSYYANFFCKLKSLQNESPSN